MSLWFIAFILGVIYGYVNPGKEDRINILKKAVIIGIVIGAIIGFAFAAFIPFAGVIFAGFSIISSVLFTLYFAIAFVIGTIVGDFLEKILKG